MSNLPALFARLSDRRREMADLQAEIDTILAQIEKLTVTPPPRRDLQIAMGYLNGRKQIALAAEYKISQQRIQQIIDRAIPFVAAAMKTTNQNNRISETETEFTSGK